MKAIIKRHPKKSAGAACILATVLGFLAEGRPICPLLPPPANTICMAITAGAEVGTGIITTLDSPDAGLP